jgi:ubiquinone/menaquinone biosynthesis C-methylase UbiE
MGRKRRHVGIEDPSRWVFNRIASVYEARPPYPSALVENVAALGPGKRVIDLGAGIGHLALPLAASGLLVSAIEPAEAMLEVLRARAQAANLPIVTAHAKAEALPFEAESFDVAVISDALHFLDVELTASELRRVLVPRGALAIVTCEFGATPFMKSIRTLLDTATPRRPRETHQAIRHLATLARVSLTQTLRYEDETSVDQQRLEQILRSVSFVGPAMNRERFEALREQLCALPLPRVWARSFELHVGRRWRH